MVDERDGKAPFDYFLDNVNRLQTDPRFREILRELDEAGKRLSIYSRPTHRAS